MDECHILSYIQCRKKQGGGKRKSQDAFFVVVGFGWLAILYCVLKSPKNRRIAEKPNVEKLQNVMMERSLAKIAPWWWWWHTYIIRIWPVDVIFFFSSGAIHQNRVFLRSFEDFFLANEWESRRERDRGFESVSHLKWAQQPSWERRTKDNQ